MTSAIESSSAFPPNRNAAIARMNSLSDLIRSYAMRRNYADDTTSKLSPYLRRRLVLEEELLAFMRTFSSFEQGEKFIQEVVWRTYWKGWLASHPQVWTDYLERLRQLDENLPENICGPLQSAQEGRTHLPFFNAWVHELEGTGYLHNHVRMWFASIWIFTLKLPWELGARFFLERLLDGDPASNTLSWRWVAGLHTPGKQYLARGENIAKYTSGRWTPAPGALDESAAPIPDDGLARVAAVAIERGPPESAVTPKAILLHDEDCGPLQKGWTGLPAVRFITPSWLYHSPASLTKQFIAGACNDTDIRYGDVTKANTIDGIVRWCHRRGTSELWALRPLIGFTQMAMSALAQDLLRDGITLHYADRAHDLALFPHATRGFFPFWNAAAAALRKNEK